MPAASALLLSLSPQSSMSSLHSAAGARGLSSVPTGKINEKPRGQGAVAQLPSLAHVLHTLNSIERYPNFLHRHDDTYAKQVEDELEAYVSKLREIRERREDRASILNGVKEKYRSAFEDQDGRKLAALDPRQSILTFEMLSQCLSETGKRLLSAQMKRHSQSGGDAVDVTNTTHSLADLEGALDMPLGDPKLNVVEVEVRNDGGGSCFSCSVELSETPPILLCYSSQMFDERFCEEAIGRCKEFASMVDAEVEEGSELKGRSTFDLRYVPGLEWVPDFMLDFVAKPIAREVSEAEVQVAPRTPCLTRSLVIAALQEGGGREPGLGADIRGQVQAQGGGDARREGLARGAH